MYAKLQELAHFIAKAKKKTYAGGGEGRREPFGSKNLQYEEGNYLYRDRYFGSERFGGEEVVWFEGRPIWVMNYYGGIEQETVDSERVFSFLRKALVQVSATRPFRGPRSFEEDDFKYINSSTGNLTCFKGTEKIRLRGDTIYRLEYVGGTVTK